MGRELSPHFKDNAYCLEYALIQIKVRSESTANAREHVPHRPLLNLIRQDDACRYPMTILMVSAFNNFGAHLNQNCFATVTIKA
jgi:hypothetical protein